MKKLSLKNLKLNENEMLERNQLKSVFGGYGGYGNGDHWLCGAGGAFLGWGLGSFFGYGASAAALVIGAGIADACQNGKPGGSNYGHNYIGY